MRSMDIHTPGLDASSAIILHRAGLLSVLSPVFTIHTVRTVVDEVVCGPEGDVIAAFLDHGQVHDRSAAGPFGPGENGLLALWGEGIIDALFTDDGACLRHCRAHDIPHYSSIVIPYLLFVRGILNRETGLEAMDRVAVCGHYAAWVIDHARTMWGDS